MSSYDEVLLCGEKILKSEGAPNTHGTAHGDVSERERGPAPRAKGILKIPPTGK